MRLESVSLISIPEGNGKRITKDGTTIWSSAPDVNYLCFEPDETYSRPLVFRLAEYGNPDPVSLEYSKNGYLWSQIVIGQDIGVYYGEKLYIRGDNQTISKSESNYYYFEVLDGRLKASGSVMTLLDKTDTLRSVPAYGFCKLFHGTNMTFAPELPATTLSEGSYSNMFASCWYLKEAPDLPAMNISKKCYSSMFQYCGRLEKSPDILPATTLAESCYDHMFDSCTNLIYVPELPATTLAKNCYFSMFGMCSSIEEAPFLHEEASESYCYGYMFYGCSSLNKISVNFKDWSYSYNMSSWVYGVAAAGTFYCPPELEEVHGDNSIPTGWTVVRI